MHLYFIDSTGSYPVRAFAIGNQSIQVNTKLRSVDFTNYTKEEGVQKLVKLITDTSSSEDEEMKQDEKDDSRIDQKKMTPLPKNTILEIATMDAKTGAFTRMRRNKKDANTYFNISYRTSTQ